MGRKSTREDKNIWQRSREAAGMTRAEAAEAMGFVSESRIEKYESGRSPVQPEEVLAMSKAYRMPALCNQYCAHECPIGKEMVPEVRAGSLSQIVLETLAKVNALCIYCHCHVDAVIDYHWHIVFLCYFMHLFSQSYIFPCGFIFFSHLQKGHTAF